MPLPEHIEFLGSFFRVDLPGDALSGMTLRADLPVDVVRGLEGQTLSVVLRKRLRVYPRPPGWPMSGREPVEVAPCKQPEAALYRGHLPPGTILPTEPLSPRRAGGAEGGSRA
jgi:hypothetical protein